MIEVTKKKKETTLSLLKRFGRRIKQSGNLARFKQARFKTRKKSGLKKKSEALKKIEKRAQMNELYKMGKIKYKVE